MSDNSSQLYMFYHSKYEVGEMVLVLEMRVLGHGCSYGWHWKKEQKREGKRNLRIELQEMPKFRGTWEKGKKQNLS